VPQQAQKEKEEASYCCSEKKEDYTVYCNNRSR